MKFILLLSLLIGLISCKVTENVTTVSSGARSPGSVNETLPIRWDDSSLPLNLYVSDDFSFVAGDLDGNGRNPIEQMQKEWDDGVAGKVLFNYGLATAPSKGSDALSTYKDSIFGVYKSDDWFSSVSSSALAITQFYAYKRTDSSGEYYQLSHADIIVNEKDYDFGYGDDLGSTYDMRTVILHEAGHLLGLTHQSDSTIAAVMQPYLSAGEANRSLFSNDTQRISDNYSDTALSSGASASYLPSGIPDGEEIHGVIELMSSGECKHFRNGKLIRSHYSF